jgi:DNA helicase HerA-like ATPase
LQLADWKLLMGIAEGTQMYAKTMSLILGDLRGRVTVEDLRDSVTASTLTPAQKTTALNRISFVEPYVRSGEAISQVIQPGRLVIVDLRDELMDKGEALSLFMVLLNRFTQARHNGKSFNKIIVFDEAHKYMDDPALTNAITEAVREMRHKGASIVVASQNPPSVPEEIIELSSIILAHKFTSPAWLKHLQKVSQAFVDMKSSQFTHLGPGQAFAWAAGNPKYIRPQRIQMRPRLTRHGGATRKATG